MYICMYVYNVYAPNMLIPIAFEPARAIFHQCCPGQGTTQRYCCMEPEPWIPSSGLFDGKADPIGLWLGWLIKTGSFQSSGVL